MKRIRSCTACSLCANQPPLLQRRIGQSKVMFIGLSAVRADDAQGTEPLSESTRSGALIRSAVSRLPVQSVYYTNLVKCLPLSRGKIRYPSSKELDACSVNLDLELRRVRPRKIILLGRIVSDYVADRFGLRFATGDTGWRFPTATFGNAQLMAADHPSYTLIYKHKEVDAYRASLRGFVECE